MALLRCDVFSDVLQVGTTVNVVLPQVDRQRIGGASLERSGPPPVLYLLHGLSDDATMWLRQTSIERYAVARGLAVVMPQVQRSFYTDQVHGGAFWTYLSQELPTMVEQFFNVSTARDDTFVAGLSMGGYGAMRWALRHPEMFAAAASLSGALDVVELSRDPVAHRAQVWAQTYAGTPVADTDRDVFHLLDNVETGSAPRLYLACGTEDELCDQTRSFVARATQRGLDVHLDLGPGEHEWGYWDAQIAKVIDWLPLRQPA